MRLGIDHAPVRVVDLMVEDVVVFGGGAALAVGLSHIILVLADSFQRDLRFANVGGGAQYVLNMP